MDDSHSHLCPNCQSYHFHEHDFPDAVHRYIRHKVCPTCHAKKLITPDSDVRPLNPKWAG